LKFSGVTILQGVEFPIFLLIFEWALQQCSATALPVMQCAAFSLHSSQHTSPILLTSINSLYYDVFTNLYVF